MRSIYKKTVRNQETIFEMEHRLKIEAKELAKKHVDIKPVKYLIK